MIESRLEQIEATIRREFPGLPDGAQLIGTPTEPGEGEKGGIRFPIPEGFMVGMLVPNPKWPAKQPQYRRVARWRPAAEYAHFEKVRSRIVGAPDVLLMDFRSAAADAVRLAQDMRELN